MRRFSEKRMCGMIAERATPDNRRRRANHREPNVPVPRRRDPLSESSAAGTWQLIARRNVRPHVPPWHERLTSARVVRRAARAAFFSMLRRALSTDDGRAILHDTLGDRLPRWPVIPSAQLSSTRPTPISGARVPPRIRPGRGRL